MGRSAGDDPHERTRVVYIIDNLAFRAGERSLLELVAGLPRARYQPAVACTPGGPFVERLHDLGVPVIAAEMRRRRLDLVLSLARELRHRRPHVVHTRGLGDPFGRVAARLARVPAVVSTRVAAHGRRDVHGPWRRLLHRAIDRSTDRLVDRHIVEDQASVDFLVSRHGLAASRISVIPTGVDPKRFDPQRHVRGVWRSRLRVPEGATLVGAAGHLTPEKGFGALVRALASLDRTDLVLAIAGDGPELDGLLELSRGLGVSDRVRLPGFVEEIAGFLAELDLFVLPARGGDADVGGAPGHLALLEAMAMERPVVATDTYGVAEKVTDGIDGRLVPPGDIAALAAAIAQLADEPEVARRLGMSARRKVCGAFTLDRMVRRTASLYDGLLAEKGLTAPSGPASAR